jgi:hypothetical protein
MIIDDDNGYSPLKDQAEKMEKSKTVKFLRRLFKRKPVTPEYKLKCYLYVSVMANIILLYDLIKYW